MTKIRANQTEVEEILNDPSAGATTDKKGSVEIATQTEVDAGVDTLRSITPDTLSNAIVTQGGGLYEPLDVTILRTSDINPLGEQILSSGDIGSTVSSVSHLHVGIYEPVFSKNTGFNLNLGTIGGTVSEGDHTHALDDLSDVVSSGSPLLTGHVLTYDGADWINQTPASGITDHDLLSNNGGVGSHATITSHIADSTIHFSTLDGLSDVVLGSPITNQVLTYDGANWTNADTVDVAAGGADTQLQYNNGGAFGGTTQWTFDDTTNVGKITGTASIDGSAVLEVTNDATAFISAALRGNDSALTGQTFAVIGLSSSTGGTAMLGQNTSATGTTYGVKGVTSSPNGVGVLGQSAAGIGGYFENTDGTDTEVSLGLLTDLILGSVDGTEKFKVTDEGIATFVGGVDKLTTASSAVSVAAALAPTTGQVLTATNGTTAVWQTPSGGGSPVITVLNDLTDVTLGSPVTDQVLTFDGANWVNAGSTGEANNNWLTANAGGDFGTAPTATTGSISLGNAAVSQNSGSISIGNGTLTQAFGIAIGEGANASANQRPMAIGYSASATGTYSLALGMDATASNTSTVSIGDTTTASGNRSIAIGSDTTAVAGSSIVIGSVSSVSSATNGNCIVLGNNIVIPSAHTNAVTIGNNSKTELASQIVVGDAVDSTKITTTDVAYSVKIGSGVAGNINILHLFSKGKLELVGDEAQFVFPNYAVGSPATYPANSIEGGVIYDSVAKGLEIYGGSPAGWSAIGGGGSVALNDLTDVALGSPVTNEVLTFDGSNWINAGTTGEANNNWLTANNGVDFTIAPDAPGTNSIALGYDAYSRYTNSIAIGTGTDSGQLYGVAIGSNATISTGHANGIAIGKDASGQGDSIAIGNGASASSLSLAIGKSCSADGDNVSLGRSNIVTGGNASAFGISMTVAGTNAVGIGVDNTADLTNQVSIGTGVKAPTVTTDVAYSVKVGHGTTGVNKNMLHLFSKGKLELYGDEAQYIFPSYAVTGSPIDVPANSVEGGVIYDSVAKGLELYDGTSWSAIGGGGSVALNDLTDVALGSPVTNEVLTFDGSNWINAGTTGEANKNWLVADNGDNFATAPTAPGANSISLGNNAYCRYRDSVSIGTSTNSGGSYGVAIGKSATVSAGHPRGVAIGNNAKAGTEGIGIGNGASGGAGGSAGIAIGRLSSADGNNIAIGELSAVTGNQAVAIGKSATATGGYSTAVGNNITTALSRQVVVGASIAASSVTSDVLYSAKIGYGSANTLKNMLHLFSKGKLELYGDEAQYIFPSYVVTGSPFETPANSVEGGVIYDSIAKGLEIYDGTSWSAIGGGGSVALNDLTDVALGSPVTNEVLTFDGSNWVNSTPGVVNNWITANNGVDFTTPPSAPQAGEFDIAIGDSAVANGSTIGGAVAIGSSAIGFLGGAQATAGFSTAVGSGTVASGQSSTAIGAGALASGNSSFAAAGDALGAYSIAINIRATARNTDDIAIGQYASTGTTGARSIAIGRNATTSNGVDNAVVIGSVNTAALDKQVIIGNAITGADVTSDVAYSVKLGTGTADANKNMLHLYSKGKLELYGDEAQYIFPSYAVTGSPVDVPANAVEGGVIYDSVAKGLQLYDGASWGDVAPTAASTKPIYEAIVIAGSPVSAVVTTTVSTVALTGAPLLAGLLVFRNGAQQSEGVMEGSPLQPSEDFAVTGANELTFGTGVLEVGNKINIYVFE